MVSESFLYRTSFIIILKAFSSSIFSLISLAVDLMKKMLQKDPRQRISAQEALNHQWIATGGVFMSPRTMAPIYLSSAQENMKRFQEE